MDAPVENILLKNGLAAILNIAFTNIISNLTAEKTQCVANFFEPSGTSTVLIAISSTKEYGPCTLPRWSTCTNKTFIVIDEMYDRNFSETNYHVDFGVAILDCQDTKHQLLWKIKNKRFISVRMKLLVFIDPQCRNKSQEEVANSQLSTINKILNPAYAMVVTGDVSYDTCWSRTFGKSFVSRNPNCDFPEVEIFHGHTLKVVADVQDPYVLSPTGNGGFLEGIEIKILEEFALRMGKPFTWVKMPPGETARVLRNEKGEYSGIIGVLHRLEADLGFGGVMILPERGAAVEVLPSHTDDALKWFIPAAPKVQNWGAVISVFTNSTWCLVVTVFICFGITLAWILRYSSASDNFRHALSDAFTRTTAALLDQSIAIHTNDFLLSFLLWFYILYCLVITNAYRSSLITALTADYEGKWYETAEEYVADGAISYLMISGKDIYEEAAKNEPIWRIILKPERHVNIFSYLVIKDVAAAKQGMVLCIVNTCKTIVLSSLMGQDMKPKMIMLKEKFMSFPIAMLMAPGSPLYPALHKRTMWLIESGLVELWQEESDRKSLLIANRLSHYVDEGPRNLSVGHLVPVFFTLTFGLVFSLCSFVLEIFYKLKIFEKICGLVRK